MTQQRLISLLLLLGLVLGQAFSLAHGIEHSLSGENHQVCVKCLSSPHQYSFVPATTLPDYPGRHIAPDFTPATDSVHPCQSGYSSRAPPLTLS